MTSQQRGSGRGHIEEQDNRPGSQDRVREGSVTSHAGSQPEYVHRERLRLQGRQALLDLLVRAERDRQRELQSLLEHHAVSDFAHRNRIQVIYVDFLEVQIELNRFQRIILKSILYLCTRRIFLSRTTALLIDLVT